MAKTEIRTDGAPTPGGSYSQGIQAGGFVFTAGQVGIDPATGKLAGDTIEEQTTQVLDNLTAVLGGRRRIARRRREGHGVPRRHVAVPWLRRGLPDVLPGAATGAIVGRGQAGRRLPRRDRGGRGPARLRRQLGAARSPTTGAGYPALCAPDGHLRRAVRASGGGLNATVSLLQLLPCLRSTGVSARRSA